MRLSLHILGTEVLVVSTEPLDDDGPGEITSTSAGFVPPIDQPAREPGRDFE